MKIECILESNGHIKASHFNLFTIFKEAYDLKTKLISINYFYHVGDLNILDIKFVNGLISLEKYKNRYFGVYYLKDKYLSDIILPYLAKIVKIKFGYIGPFPLLYYNKREIKDVIEDDIEDWNI